MTDKTITTESIIALDPQPCDTWEERALGNIFIRKMRFRSAGDYMHGHKHNFDHTTIVFTGSIHVFYTLPNGEKGSKVYTAPKPGEPTKHGDGYVLIKAGVEHEIIALSDYTEAWCVFAHRDDHGEVVQQYQGNLEATH